MQREIVEKRHWLSEQQYLNALSFCLLLPGPEAMQLATYAGWRRAGLAGGLLAGLSFIGPGALIILALAMIYIFFGQSLLLASLFSGVKAAVIVIVLHSLLRIVQRTMTDIGDWSVAALAFIGIFFLDLPFPLILLAAAIFGVFGKVSSETGTAGEQPSTVQPSATRTLMTVVVGLAIWLLPLLGMALLAGQTVLPELAQFFAKLAVVTFGGAYAVLAYMGQEVVTHHHWLSTPEMMDGCLAETTPLADSGDRVCRFHCRLSRCARRIWRRCHQHIASDFRLCRRAGDALGHLCPLFPVDFQCRPLLRMDCCKAKAEQCLGGITAAIVGVIANLSVWFALRIFCQVGWWKKPCSRS